MKGTVEELLVNAREIRINEEYVFRQTIAEKQRELDAVHAELYQLKEELMNLKKRFCWMEYTASDWRLL